MDWQQGETRGGYGFAILQFGFNWESFGATEAGELAVEAHGKGTDLWEKYGEGGGRKWIDVNLAILAQV